jgi:hypothetical protein
MAVDTVDFPAAWPKASRPGVYPIPLVKKTIAAFVGRAERGPVDEPVRIRAFSDYARTFGGPLGSSTMPHAVQDFFLHGGHEAVVVRVANRATRARIDVPAGGQFLHLQARHPGRHEVVRVSVDYDEVHAAPDRFNLVVQRLRSEGSALIADQELYPSISMNHNDDRFVVDALKDSRLVRLNGPLPAARPDATPAHRPGQAVRYIETTACGTDGDELTDYDIIGSNKEGTGLFALDRAGRIDVLCIPSPLGRELGNTAYLAAERYCEKRRAILIWDPPWSWRSAHAAIMGARSAGRESQNALTYYPRVRLRGESARFADGLPACGAVAGMLAKQDARGIWRADAPAGLELRGSFAAAETLGSREMRLLQRAGVMTFVRTPEGRIVLAGNVTIGGPALGPARSRLDRRRLRLFIVSSIETSTEWVRHHLDAPDTGARLEHQIRTFLQSLLERGAFAGRSPAQAYTVHVTRAAGEPGDLVLRFGFALDHVAELSLYEAHFGVGRAARVRSVVPLEVSGLVG